MMAEFEPVMWTVDTCWEFYIDKHSNKEFDAILKCKSIMYVLMEQIERDDDDGYDLSGYIETLYAVDETRVRKDLNGFERATLSIGLDDPEYYDYLYKGDSMWTERGIRKDMLRQMVRLVCTSTAKEKKAPLLRRCGSAFHRVWTLERRKKVEDRRAMRDYNLKLRPWQIEALDLLEKQDNDNILYIEAPEDAGKSELGLYIKEQMGGFMTTECLDQIIRKYYRQQPYLVLDLSLGNPPEDLLIEMKSGKMYNGNKILHFTPPKVLVMSRAFNPAINPATCRVLVNEHLQ